MKTNDLPKQPLRLRFRTGDMMLAMAFFGLWLGMAVTMVPLGTKANVYRQRARNARAMADLFQGLADKQKAEIKLRTENVAKLRERKVPDGLLDIQRDFLRKLDAEGPPRLREERYRLIMDGQSRLLKQALTNEETFRTLAANHRVLKTKYEAAMIQPWIQVPPDPDPMKLPGVRGTIPPTPAASSPPVAKPQSGGK